MFQTHERDFLRHATRNFDSSEFDEDLRQYYDLWRVNKPCVGPHCRREVFERYTRSADSSSEEDDDDDEENEENETENEESEDETENENEDEDEETEGEIENENEAADEENIERGDEEQNEATDGHIEWVSLIQRKNGQYFNVLFSRRIIVIGDSIHFGL